MPTEGQTATGPNGQKAVYRGGQWVVLPSQGSPAPVTVAQGNPIAMPQAQADLDRTRAQTIAATAAERDRAAAAERQRLEWEATHFPDGTPKPKAAEAAVANPDRIPQILTVLDNIKQLRAMSDDTLAVGAWSGRVGDWPLVGPFLGQNRKNVEGALQMVQGDLIQQQIARLSEMNGGKGVASIANSETEAARMAASIANLSPDQDLSAFTLGLDRAEQYYLRELARQEGADLSNPEVRKFYDIHEPGAPPAPPNALTRLRIGNASPTQTAGFGATEGRTVVVPPEMSAEADALKARLMEAGGGRIDPAAFAQGMGEIVSRYPQFENDPGAWEAWARDINDYLNKGGKTVPSGVNLEDRPLSGVEWLRNSIVDNPVGSAVAGAANAGGFGIPSLLAGDQYEALRENRPVSQFIGELGGAVTGAGLTGKALGIGAKALAEGSVASRLVANPLTAETVYGAAYGATQGDDPVMGALLGGGFSLGGGLGGKLAGRALPRLTGTALPEDALSRGERMVFDAVGGTGQDAVIEALRQADSLGVPASLADVSPAANSLTGAALRRSPEAAGDARLALGERSRGQYDRFLGAVERDLGPIENIPQLSEDLITQARAKAGPLYDQAYAAPGAGAVTEKIAPLMQRPSMQRALGNARRLAQEEGRDPTSLGFDLSDQGEVVLTRTPSWQTLDYVKRGLDDVVEGYRDKTTGKLVLDTEGRAVNDTLRDFLKIVDTANPDYAAARAAYAGPAAERDAMQRGAAALNMSPNQLGVNMGRASPSQADQMRLGFQSALGEKAGNFRQSTNPFEAMLGTPGMEQRLATLYPDSGDEVARLLAQRDLERQLAGSTNRLIGNSATAERHLADQQFGAQSSLMGDAVPMMIETGISGAPWATGARAIASRLGGQAIRDMRTLGIGRRGQEAADQVIPLALNMNPAAAETALLDLAQRDEAYQAIVYDLLRKAGTRGSYAGAGLGAAGGATLAR